jgi:hypothetical protein
MALFLIKPFAGFIIFVTAVLGIGNDQVGISTDYSTAHVLPPFFLLGLLNGSFSSAWLCSSE